jgi:hypothetical protein
VSSVEQEEAGGVRSCCGEARHFGNSGEIGRFSDGGELAQFDLGRQRQRRQ